MLNGVNMIYRSSLGCGAVFLTYDSLIIMLSFKTFIASFALLTAAVSAGAQNKAYNRISISYENEHLPQNLSGAKTSMGLDGFGIGYIHGFSLSSVYPVYIESGIKYTSMWWGETFTMQTRGLSYGQYHNNISLATFSVPLNLAFQFTPADDVYVTPYIGVNMKMHISGKYSQKSVLENNEVIKDSWSVFDDSDEAMGNQGTWNRFQAGWQIGIGIRYAPYYLGVSWGTDFNRICNSSDCKISSRSTTITVGYTF